MSQERSASTPSPGSRATARSRSSWTTTAPSRTATSRSPSCAASSASWSAGRSRSCRARHAHLRRLPRQPPHGQREGRRRLLRRRGGAAGREAAAHVLQRALHPQPHRPLLRAGGAGLRARARRRPGHPQRARRGRQGRAGDRRRGHRLARPRRRRSSSIIGGRSTHVVWCIPGGVSKGLKPEELDEIRPMVADAATSSRSSRCSCSATSCSPTRRTSTSSERPVHPRRPEHGAGRRERRPELLRRPGPRGRLRGQGDLHRYEAKDYADYVAEHVEPWTLPQVPLPQAARLEGVRGRASTRASTAPRPSPASTWPSAWRRPRRRRRSRRCSRRSAATRAGCCWRSTGPGSSRWSRTPRRCSSYCDDPEITGDAVPRHPAADHRRGRRHRRGDARHAHAPLHLRRERHLHQRQPHRRHDQQQRAHPDGHEEGRRDAHQARERARPGHPQHDRDGLPRVRPLLQLRDAQHARADAAAGARPPRRRGDAEFRRGC